VAPFRSDLTDGVPAHRAGAAEAPTALEEVGTATPA
jgi:hypothetical protein